MIVSVVIMKQQFSHILLVQIMNNSIALAPTPPQKFQPYQEELEHPFQGLRML